MKTAFLITLALFNLIYGISQDEYLPSPRSISISHADCKVEINGSRSDDVWSLAEVHELPYSAYGTTVIASNLYAELQIVWNTNLGIYAFVHVEDNIDWFFDAYWYSLDEEENENLIYTDGPWHRDNVEFFFFWGNEGEWGPEQNSSSTSDSVWSQIRFNVCYYDEGELETCLTVYAPGLDDDDNFYLGTPGSNSDKKIIDAVAVSTSTGWDLEVNFPFDIFAKRTDLNSEKNIPIGFECFVNDAELGIKHSAQLFLLNDSGVPALWNNRRFLNTAILQSPNSANITECEPASISNFNGEQVPLFKTIPNGIFVLQEIYKIRIYNLSGSLLFHKQYLAQGQYQFDLNPGIYIVFVNDAFVEKMIVE